MARLSIFQWAEKQSMNKPPPSLFSANEAEPSTARLDIVKILQAIVFFSFFFGGISLLSTFLIRSPGWERLRIASLLSFLLAGFMWAFLRHGYYKVVAGGMVAGYSAIIIYGTIIGIGVRGTAYAAFAIIVILAALFIHRYAGYLIASIGALFGLFLIWAEQTHHFINPSQPMPLLATWINISAYFLIVASLLDITLRHVDNALQQQARAEEKLRQLNTDLEMGIAQRTAELSASEARYRLIAEYASDVIWVTDLNLVLTYISPSVERARGLTVEEAMRQPIREAFTPASYEKAMRLFAEEMSNPDRHRDPGYSRLIELEYTRKDGSTYWCEVKVSFLRDEKGKPTGIIGVARDIDARKKIEQALRESENRYRLISTLSSDYAFSSKVLPGGAFEVDWVMGAFESITGYTLAEYKARGGWRSILSPESLPKDDQAREILLKNRKIETEMQIMPRTGPPRWVHFNAHPVWDEKQNQLIAVYGAGKDITAQKKAEIREKLRREMLEKVIQLGQAVTQTVTLSACLQQIHHSLRHELGFDRVGLLLYDPQQNEFQDAFSMPVGDIEDSAWYLRARSEHENWNMVMKTPKGLSIIEEIPSSPPPSPRDDTRPMRQHATLAAWAGDKPVALIAVDNALTRLPLTDEKLEALKLFAGYAGLAIETARWKEQLERRVTERTAELENANRELQDFSYTIAHDLRAPARGMIGFSRLLQEEFAQQMNAEGLHYLERVHSGAQRMGQMIDELLAFTQLGRQPIRKQLLNMNTLVQQALKEFADEQEARQITLHLSHLPNALADPEMLEKAWTQLIKNAFKFTRKVAHPEIIIGAKQHDNEVEYFIKDNGIGFELKFANKLFGVFQRMHLEEDYEGTGMGLAFVHRIITRHGGQVWAEAETDCGATFFFTLGANF